MPSLLDGQHEHLEALGFRIEQRHRIPVDLARQHAPAPARDRYGPPRSPADLVLLLTTFPAAGSIVRDPADAETAFTHSVRRAAGDATRIVPGPM